MKLLIAAFLIAIAVIGSSLAGLTRFGLAQDFTIFKISGYILDPTGQGIAGAELIFGVPDIVPSVNSDSSGYYEIFTPAGTYHVNVWPPFDSNFISYGESGFVVESDKTKNITLNSGYKVSGYITDSSGSPIVRAVVALDKFFCGWYSTTSGYYFVNAPAGTYTLSARPAKGPRDVTDFSPYYEYDVAVDSDIVKNIIIGGSSPSPTPLPTSNITNSGSDSWPMFHNDLAHSGYSKSTGPLTNQILWKFQTGSSVESSPAVVDGVVYFGALWNGHNGIVYAVNAATGSKIWQFATDGGVESSPAVVNGVVYIGSYTGRVFALNATDGSQLWSFNTGGSVFPSPAVIGGMVYIGSASGYMFALNATDGSQLWSFNTSDCIFSSPAVVDGVVYFASDDKNVYALKASDGSQIWRYTTNGYVDSSPVVVDGMVYLGSRGGYVNALNAIDGSQIWSFLPPHGSNTGTTYYYSTPAVTDGVVYVGGYDGYIYALNAATGSVFWEFPTEGYIFSSPVVAGGVVYVGSFDHNVYALNAITGNKIWSYKTGDQMRSSAAVANGVVYVGSGDGYLYAFGSQSAQQTSCKISGYVLDANGHGIGGANVIFNVPSIVPSVLSDASGYYTISAPAGTYHVNVWPPFDSNYIHYDEPGLVVASDMTKNITLYTGYKVSGYISFSNGTPVVGAAVIFRNSTNTWFGSGWFSNAKGYYFLNVPDGTYMIDAHPRTGNYYSGPTTDFPPYYEYNFTVNRDTVKNITIGGLSTKSSQKSESVSSFVLSPEPSPKPSPESSLKPSSSPPAEVTPAKIITSTKASSMTLLGIVLGIMIAATPIVTVISSLLFYFKKRKH